MIWSGVGDVGHVPRRGLHDSAGGPAIIRTMDRIPVGRWALPTSPSYNSARFSLHACVSFPMASRYRPVFIRLTVPADAIGPVLFAVARCEVRYLNSVHCVSCGQHLLR